MRLCTEFNKSIPQHFSDMPHFVAFPRWPPLTLRATEHMAQNLKHTPIYLKIVSNRCLVTRIKKNVVCASSMLSLSYVRKGHERSFRIFTGIKSK